jgi:DNA-binding NarL/FixJ family response regulator
LRVCVFSFHPLVFPAIKTFLAGRRATLEPRPLSDAPPEEGVELQVPRADAYLVQLGAEPSATERVIERILNSYPSARLVVLGEGFDPEVGFRLLQIGTNGLVTYREASAQLGPALEAVTTGGYWVTRSLLSQFVERTARSPESPASRLENSPIDLTRREREVLKGVLEHLSNKEIASKLELTERTVKFHVSNLLAKCRVRRRRDLMLFFMRQPPPEPTSGEAAGQAPQA